MGTYSSHPVTALAGRGKVKPNFLNLLLFFLSASLRFHSFTSTFSPMFSALKTTTVS
jgi:hypothetical protein